MQPHKIIYVSCNPATQARDLAMLDSLYQIEKIQPVDMFPHTHHVENVVLLRKRLD
jgi:23S rRNA (uracil1939-C5)-methyltransferase